MMDPTTETVAPAASSIGPEGYADASRDVWGGKGAALARLANEFPVPPLAVIPPAVADDDLDAAVEHALAMLAHPSFVAVRSSARDEDGADDSFAGTLDSFLFIPPADVARRVREVRASSQAERVQAYRSARGLDGAMPTPAVLIQTLVDADIAGVAFSADPVSGADVAVVSAVRGLGSALVDGRAEGDTVRVARDGSVRQRNSATQVVADRYSADAGGVTEVEESTGGPVLSDEDAARVAALAVRVAETEGSPQDIEWAIADGELWLLQARPITTLGGASGTLRLWDNANIVESYAGVTTPLTFSFARRAYTAVYRTFCQILRVPGHRIEAESETFEQMIGLIRGRVYYNLRSWYRVLALLPGYRLNAGLMEGMMGAREIAPELRPEPPTSGRIADALALVRMVVGLIVAYVRLPGMRRRFLARVEGTLTSTRVEADASLDALAEAYTRIDARLLKHWDAPLVNDFFAMIWFGLANRAAEAWIGPGAIGGLLAGDGEVVSAEPARRIDQMAGLVDEPLAEVLMTGAPDAARDAVAGHPPLAETVAAYVDRFGDRCLEELKLESPTLADDPLPLLRAIGARARTPESTADPGRQRAEAEAQAADALRGHPIRRLAFGLLLRQARGRVRDRENLRFERTRVFGRARRLVVAMGERLAEARRLDEPRDVFYLEIDELLGLARGTASTHDASGLVATRRAEFERYRTEAAPPDRFTTRGPVATAPLVPDVAPIESASGDVRDGLGCCAGVVEGSVRVVRDPRGVELAPGTILVAERTDPGWVLLFPACAGLVVERGSLLSHSAIVARELGIPAAVSVPGATSWLADGDRVRLDGATGRVERIDG